METTMNTQPSMSQAQAIPAPQIPQSGAASEGLDPKIMSALSYFCGIIAIVALVMEPHSKNKTVRFHAFQALLFGLSAAVISIVLSTISFSVTLFLAGLSYGALYNGLRMLVGLVSGLAWLSYGTIVFGTWVYLMVSSSQGKTVKLPLLGKFASRLAGN